MPNQLATVQDIARRTLPRLVDLLVFPGLIHRDFSEEFQQGKGATVKIKKPVVLTAEEFNATTGVNTQDIVQDTVSVTLDHLATVDVDIGALQASTETTGYVSQGTTGIPGGCKKQKSDQSGHQAPGCA